MILVVVEHEAGQPDRNSLEALSLGRRLAGGLGAPLHAAVVGAADGPLGQALGSQGVDTIHALTHEGLSQETPVAWGKAVAGLVGALAPVAVLSSGTDRGAEVMAHVAARTGLPLAANCIDVRLGDPWEVTRQRWGGSLLEETRLDRSPRLITVALHAVAAGDAPTSGRGLVETVVPELSERDLAVRVVRRVAPDASKISLADARVVVGGGRGVGSAEGFAQIDELAQLLGGAVGVSRAVTSAGWRPHMEQVGQTGQRIAPELYIACGISGAIQHMVGARTAKRILAINTDADAPMVAQATYAVIGDLHTILPAIIAEIKQSRGA